MESRARHNTESRGQSSTGLVANGSAGAWDVALDETLAGEQQWFLQIEGPVAYLYFRVSDPGVVDRILGFLDVPPGASTTECGLDMGWFGKAPVSLTWDREVDRRCVVLVDGDEESRLRVTVASAGLADLIAAFRQVRSDLQDAGLLAEAT